jgi:hypothetical protein
MLKLRLKAMGDVDVGADPVDLDVDVEVEAEMEGDCDADGDMEAWVDCVEGGFGILFPCCRWSFHRKFVLHGHCPCTLVYLNHKIESILTLNMNDMDKYCDTGMTG